MSSVALRLAALGLSLSLGAVASAASAQPLHPMITFLPPGQLNHPYLAKNLIAGGVPPYVVAQLDGALPRGMAISGAGALYGTPRVAGTFRFKIDFKDSADMPAALTLSYTLQVDASHPPPRNTLLGPTGS